MKRPLSIFQALKPEKEEGYQYATVLVPNTDTVDVRLTNGTIIRGVPISGWADKDSQVVIQFRRGQAVAYGASPMKAASNSGGTTVINNTTVVTGGGGGGGGALTAHALSDVSVHTGTLADAQAPQFVKLDGSRVMTASLWVSPTTVMPPFVIGSNAADVLVTGLNADKLDGLDSTAFIQGSGTAGLILQWLTPHIAQDSSLAKIGAGLLTLNAAGAFQVNVLATGDVALGAGTLGVSTGKNVAVPDHVHPLDWSSNPGSASKILGSSPTGTLQLVAIGLGVAPTYPVHVRLPSTQMRLEFDATHYADVDIDSGGNARLKPTGLLVVQAGGEAFVPNQNYTHEVGLDTRMFLTGNFAELRARTLVAQDIMATTGGRIITAPSNTLVLDCLSTA